MAAPPLTRVLRLAAWLLAALAAVPVVFGLAAWIGSAIPRNANWSQPDRGVEIMVGTNGVHTEIIMPLVTPQKDWRTDFPVTDIGAPDAPYTHIAVSWGEREVFLNTPTWADLSIATALRALTGGEGLLHVSHYVRPAPDDDFRPLRISAAHYARLVKRIERSVVPAQSRISFPGYFAWDVFYAAPGRYRWNNTCNQWTSDSLAAAGVRTGWWTPLAGGVMKWVPSPRLD